MWSLLRILPKNHISYFFGKIAEISSPKFLAKAIIGIFVRMYKVDLSDAERGLKDYHSLQDFFTRKLKKSARSIAGGVVSPVDGTVSQLGMIDTNLLLQIKGKNYSLENLLVDTELAKLFYNGFFITIYLAPDNYHRIHSPVSAKISRMLYIPGKLWPVNSWSVSHIDELFAQNERIISLLESVDHGVVAVVKVGATNVGSISLSYDSLKTNKHFSLFQKKQTSSKSYSECYIERGEELGVFELGSTVILLFQEKRFQCLQSLTHNKKVLFGEQIGV